MADFFDTHAHLDHAQFHGEVAEVVARARAAGITRMISIGTDLESSRRAVALSEVHEEIFAVVGWHPSDVMEAPEDVRPDLRELARHPRVVAIGETGVDYYRLAGPPGEDARIRRRQAEVFQQQLEVASELGLNCVIHQRARAGDGTAMDDALRLLGRFEGSTRGVFHCFSGDADAMRRVIAIGSLVSFTGIVTFKNGQVLRETLKATPMDRFMLETDSPFMAPEPYRGRRCEPAFVKEISEVAAAVKGCDLDELSARTCANARGFFPGLG